MSRVWVPAGPSALFASMSPCCTLVKVLGRLAWVLVRLNVVMVYVTHLLAWPTAGCLTKSFSPV